MKVSIITAVYNRVETISHTIESVLGQTYPDIEYIVVDGMSDDGTDRIISKYGDRIGRQVREKDHGIYDALNKGIRLATGDVVGLLHADDFFAHRDVIASLVEEFSMDRATMGVYGDLVYVDNLEPTRTVRRWISGKYDVSNYRWGWMPPHPTVYFRRECYVQYGRFRDDFQLAADYELLLRMMMVHGVPMRYIAQTLVCMRVGGKSNASFSNRMQANREDAKAWRVNGLRPPIGLRFLKPLRKIYQYF
jgi:glycosyltransferase